MYNVIRLVKNSPPVFTDGLHNLTPDLQSCINREITGGNNNLLPSEAVTFQLLFLFLIGKRE